MRIIFPDNRNRNPSFERFVQKIPLLIFITSCLAPIVAFLFHYFWSLEILGTLALSVEGIRQHKVWQLITYPLINADSLCLSVPACTDITQRFLIKNVLIFVFFRQATNFVIRKLGALSLLLFFLSQTLICGLATLLLLWLIDSPTPFFGPESLACATVLIWVFLDPEKRLCLPLFPITIARKWGFAMLLGFYFFILLITGSFTVLFSSLLSLGWAMLFCAQKRIPNPYKNFIHF